MCPFVFFCIQPYLLESEQRLSQVCREVAHKQEENWCKIYDLATGSPLDSHIQTWNTKMAEKNLSLRKDPPQFTEIA